MLLDLGNPCHCNETLYYSENKKGGGNSELGIYMGIFTAVSEGGVAHS